jgi:hypothetical protein
LERFHEKSREWSFGLGTFVVTFVMVADATLQVGGHTDIEPKMVSAFKDIYVIHSQKKIASFGGDLVIQSGFEPETYRLEICCSIQLSY